MQNCNGFNENAHGFTRKGKKYWVVLGRNLIFFLCVASFTWKLDETGGFVFCFFGSKMKLAVVSWVKLAKNWNWRPRRSRVPSVSIFCQFSPMKPQPVSFLSQKNRKQNGQFHPVSRETSHTQKKKMRFLPKTLLLAIFDQILALKPPILSKWFQKNCQKWAGFNETAGWFQKNCQKLKWFHWNHQIIVIFKMCLLRCLFDYNLW